MPAPVDFRPSLAAASLLAVLAGTYEAAVQWPGRPATPVTEATRPKPEPAAAPVASAAAPSASASTPDNPDCLPQPIRFVRTRPNPMPHRYQGLVGGEPATAELRWMRPDSVTGSFYQWQRGPEYQLAGYGSRRPPFVFTLSSNYPDYGRTDGTWRLTGPLGPMLRGVWVNAAGQRRPFVLRESYASGVRYEVQGLLLSGGKPESGGIDGFACAVPSHSRDYLHLVLPPGSSPALRRWQAPPLAVRRRQLRAAYPQDSEGSSSIQVRLNDFGLLSYETDEYERPFGGQPDYEVLGTLLDLRTGQQLDPTNQLVARHRPALRRLVAHHLLHDANFDIINKDHYARWLWEEPDAPDAAADTTYSLSLWKQRRLAPLTNQAVLTAEGLELTYRMGDLSDAGTAPDQTVLVPYAELRPLVRPGTPLARMLKARGLW
ncbi:MAG: hypothetical protein ACRYFX_00350 [Janthinobacterium lividum]